MLRGHKFYTFCIYQVSLTLWSMQYFDARLDGVKIFFGGGGGVSIFVVAFGAWGL